MLGSPFGFPSSHRLRNMPYNRLRVPVNLRLSPPFWMTRSLPFLCGRWHPSDSRISMPLLRGLAPSVVDVLANAVFVSRKLILMPSWRVTAWSWSMLALLNSPTVGTSSGAVFSGFLNPKPEFGSLGATPPGATGRQHLNWCLFAECPRLR